MKERLYRSMIELTNGPVTSGFLRKFAHSKYSRPIIRLYADAYKINQEEMRDDMNDYKCLHDFFIRPLKEGARPVQTEIDTVVSPVDGILEKCGTISPDLMMTVKGKSYSIKEMVGDVELVDRYNGGTYLLLYLSPSHYHRIHSPLDATVMQSNSLGGKSYPVNRLGLKYGDRVLSKNFRTVTQLKHQDITFAMVKVGAMFINTIVLTNHHHEWKKGEEVAYFSFGSTVILLFERSAFIQEPSLNLPAEVRMGEKLGKISLKKNE